MVNKSYPEYQLILFTFMHSTALASNKGTTTYHGCEPLRIRPKLGGIGLNYCNNDYIQKWNELDVWKWLNLRERERKIKSELHRM
jgi:hypothetical protein